MSDSADSRARTWQVGALLFGSGCCALVYQTAWMREFRLVFGASTAASAAVLAIFIGGLGIGSLLLGPMADRRPRPILFYSQLESIVAVSAAATPFLLSLVGRLYVLIGGTPRLGLVGGTIGRLLLSALVLAIPTIAMGGTLPAAARGVTRQSDVRRQDVAALYALNTLGAVLGCVAATFLLLELFGTRATLWLAAALNLLVAMVARQADRSWPPLADTAPAEPASASAGEPPVPFLLVASGGVGFVFFLMELVWYRMLGPLLGGSVFTFGLILAVALVGIGLGGLLYSLISADRPATLSGFAITCLLEAVFTAAAFALGDRLAILALVMQPLAHTSFAGQVAGWTLITAIVVLPAAFVAGYQFPLLIGLFGRGRAAVGRQIGLAYAANTLGAIAGALAGGFGLIPWLSAPGAWRFSAAMLEVLSAAAVILSGVRAAGRRVLLPLALAASVAAMLAAPGPTSVWRDGGIGAGRAAITSISSRNQLTGWMHAINSASVWSVDGVESSVTLSTAQAGYAFIVNGKSDGDARADAGTQVMLGLIGAVFHPDPRRSLVIGLGTGSTAGWLAAIPRMERVDVVELEPVVLEVARACHPVNRDVMSNPKVHITIGDAREVLLTSRDQYDVIASEPSNPYRAGVASLFTQEYYAAAKDRLSPDGLFVQWVQAYEVDAATLRTIYATMASVFDQVETWQTTGSDLVLVGAKHAIPYRVPALQARIAEEPYRSALQSAWRSTDLTSFLGHFIAGDALTRAIARLPSVDLNTDDRNVVEFGFARSVGRGPLMFVQVHDLARALGADHPAVTGGGIDWGAADTAWVSYLASEQQYVGPNPRDAAAEQARQRALTLYFWKNDVSGARAAWAGQSRPPEGPNELAMVGDISAQAGSDEAEPYIEQLRAIQPAEADLVLARLRFQQRRDDEAVVALAAMFERLRSDPWPLTRFKEAGLELAEALAERTPASARPLLDAARQPFAVRALDAERRILVATLTMRAARPECAAAVGALEPFVPWSPQFLTMRRDCYAAAGDRGLERATRDLGEFSRGEGLPLAAGIVPAVR